MIKIENIACEMGPQEKNFQLAIYFYSQGVEPIVSSSCSPIDSQLPQLRIQFCPTKKIRKCHTNPIFLIWGSFSNRKKKELYIYILYIYITVYHYQSFFPWASATLGPSPTALCGTTCLPWHCSCGNAWIWTRSSSVARTSCYSATASVYIYIYDL